MRQNDPIKTDKDYVSVSEIQTWAECNYKHLLKYVKKLDVFEENVYNNFGTAIHEVAEVYIKTRVLKPELGLEIILENWAKFDLPDVGVWLKRLILIAEAIPGWLDENFPGWECVDAEEKLWVEIDETPDVNFYGFIDAIIKHNGKYHLLDWKTAGNGWNSYKKKDPLKRIQLILYNYFWAKKHKISYDDIKCGFVILNRDFDALERIDYFTFEIDNEKRSESLKVLNSMVTNLRGKKPVMRLIKKFDRKGNHLPPCRFCPFNKTEHCP